MLKMGLGGGPAGLGGVPAGLGYSKEAPKGVRLVRLG